MALASGELENPTLEDNFFFKILNEGPKKGFFTVVWCDDPVVCEDTLSRIDLKIKDFNKRVVFNVSQEQALQFAQVVNDYSIDKSNAYIFQNRKGKEKFRPYTTPLENWISLLLGEKLNNEPEDIEDI